MYIWGNTWRKKNRFQETFCQVVWFAEQGEWGKIEDLWIDLTPQQQWDIYWRLASYTRRVIKENCNLEFEI